MKNLLSHIGPGTIIGGLLMFFSGAFVFHLARPLLKWLLAHLVKPTPEKWQKIGNAFLSISGSAGSIAFVSDSKPLSYALFGCAVLGKIICSLATKTNNEKDTNSGDANNV